MTSWAQISTNKTIQKQKRKIQSFVKKFVIYKFEAFMVGFIKSRDTFQPITMPHIELLSEIYAQSFALRETLVCSLWCNGISYNYTSYNNNTYNKESPLKVPLVGLGDG